MYYGYFRVFNFICNVFGLSKPIITTNGESIKIHFWLKIWSLLVTVALVGTFFYFIDKPIELDAKHNLEKVSDINDLFVNIIIITINCINNEKICINLHQIFDAIFRDLDFDKRILKLLAYKMYFWFFTTVLIFIILIIMEFVHKYPPYVLLIRTLTFLLVLHLIMHLYLILALIKVINHQLSKILICHDKKPKLVSKKRVGIRCILKYIFSPDVQFIKVDCLTQFDLKFLSKIYDNLSTCIHLLENCYGLQIVLTIWLMFTSAVVGVTVIACNQVTIRWLLIVKSGLPFSWCFIGCYINEQLSKEVDHTVTLIIKCLIDYRCDSSRKAALDTFKKQVCNDRLQFSACSLFKFSYAMLLGTMINVITYSIILIQLYVA